MSRTAPVAVGLKMVVPGVVVVSMLTAVLPIGSPSMVRVKAGTIRPSRGRTARRARRDARAGVRRVMVRGVRTA
jgi:hypothetical protein